MGQAIEIPRKLSKEDVEFHRVEVERILNHLTIAAEKWAESHLPGENEVSFFSTATPLDKQKEASPKSRFWLQAAQRDYLASKPTDEAAVEERAEPMILPFRSAS